MDNAFIMISTCCLILLQEIHISKLCKRVPLTISIFEGIQLFLVDDMTHQKSKSWSPRNFEQKKSLPSFKIMSISWWTYYYIFETTPSALLYVKDCCCLLSLFWNPTKRVVSCSMWQFVIVMWWDYKERESTQSTWTERKRERERKLVTTIRLGLSVG